MGLTKNELLRLKTQRVCDFLSLNFEEWSQSFLA